MSPSDHETSQGPVRRYWATLAGGAVGVLGGLYGAVFGAAIGLLVDVLLNESRAPRAARAYLEGSDWPSVVPRVAVLSGALLGAISDRHSRPEVDRLTIALREVSESGWTPRLLEQIVVTSARAGWDRSETLRDAFENSLTDDQKRLVIRAVWSQLSANGESHAAKETMSAFARDITRDPGFVEHTVVVEADLDEDSCSILGVSRDATMDQIRRAYRRLAAQFHPDTLGDLNDEERETSENAFKRIVAAYEKLTSETES